MNGNGTSEEGKKSRSSSSAHRTPSGLLCELFMWIQRSAFNCYQAIYVEGTDAQLSANMGLAMALCVKRPSQASRSLSKLVITYAQSYHHSTSPVSNPPVSTIQSRKALRSKNPIFLTTSRSFTSSAAMAGVQFQTRRSKLMELSLTWAQLIGRANPYGE